MVLNSLFGQSLQFFWLVMVWYGSSAKASDWSRLWNK